MPNPAFVNAIELLTAKREQLTREIAALEHQIDDAPVVATSVPARRPYAPRGAIGITALAVVTRLERDVGGATCDTIQLNWPGSIRPHPSVLLSALARLTAGGLIVTDAPDAEGVVYYHPTARGDA